MKTDDYFDDPDFLEEAAARFEKARRIKHTMNSDKTDKEKWHILKDEKQSADKYYYKEAQSPMPDQDYDHMCDALDELEDKDKA